ncbi:MAG: hypothetical protein ACRDTE_22425 [Pseudonocardiaceae bacterium]
MNLPGIGGGVTTSAPALGGTLANQSGVHQPTAGGSGYRIDVERAPQAIADLHRAAEHLRSEAEKAIALGRITPPGLDVVSANAVRIFAEAAVGEQGSLRQALLGAANRFDSDASKLEADLRNYLGVEELSIPAARELNSESDR